MTTAIRSPGQGQGFTRLLLEYAQEQGLEGSTCLVGTELTPAILNDPFRDVLPEQELQVIRNLLVHLGDAFRHGFEIGLRSHLMTYGLFGTAIVASTRVRDAVELYERYADLLFSYTRFSIQCVGEILTLEIQPSRRIPADLSQFLIARDMGFIATFQAEVLQGQPRNVEEIGFSLPFLPGMALVEKVFDCPVRCNQPRNYLVGSAAQLDLPLPNANSITAALCEDLCQEFLNRQLTEQDLVARVRLRLSAELRYSPRMDRIAQSLNLSSRTLRRQLEREGVVWRELVAEVRRTRALELLAYDALSINQIATELGFADASAFSHAFKRWTGRSPEQFRRSRAPSANWATEAAPEPAI